MGGGRTMTKLLSNIIKLSVQNFKQIVSYCKYRYMGRHLPKFNIRKFHEYAMLTLKEEPPTPSGAEILQKIGVDIFTGAKLLHSEFIQLMF